MDSSHQPGRQGQTTPTTVIDGQIYDAADASIYDPKLYECESRYQSVDRFEDLDDAAIEHYRQQGYLVVRQAFSPDQIRDAKCALNEIINQQGVGSVSIQFESWAAGKLDKMDRRQKALAVRKFMNFADTDERLTTIARHERLLQLLCRLMNEKVPEILQDMSLLKPPQGREKPWHQDRAYFNLASDVPIVGAWIALDQATIENGCMRIWPGRHREGAILHFQRRDWQICDSDIQGQARTCVPLEPGGLLLFDSLLPHGTPENRTKKERWALQFHYCPKNPTRIDDETRMAVFGSEGKDVEC